MAGPTGSQPGTPVSPIDHLLWHAARGGAAAVQDRVEPVLVGSLRGRCCILSHSQVAGIHYEDHNVLGLLGSAKSMLTRLGGGR